MKFRAWNVKERKYYSWEFLDEDSNVIPNLWKSLDSPNGPDWVIEQFTGFADRNGNDIYVGDIVSASWGYEGVVSLEGIFYAKGDCTISDDIEIVGNVNESPELLK